MALFKSNMLSAIRGSVNGTVYSQNKSGAYMRNRSLVTNPNTAEQVRARTGFTSMAEHWRTLSDGDRDSWRTYAAGTPVTNRLGDTIYLSGMNMFMKTNAFRQFLTLAIQATAPNILGLAQQPVFTAYPAPNDEAGITPNTVSDQTYQAGQGSTSVAAHYALWISNPVSAGTQFYKGPWNYAGKLLGTTRASSYTSPITILEATHYFFRLRVIDEIGRLAAEQIVGPVISVTAV